MVERQELAGLVLGFVVLTFGAIAYVGGSRDLSTVVVIVLGGLVGFAAAASLVVHYHMAALVGG